VFSEARNQIFACARARDAPNVSSAAQAARTREHVGSAGFYSRALACRLHGVGPTHLAVHLDLSRGVGARAEEEEGRKRHGEDKAGQHDDCRFPGLVWFWVGERSCEARSQTSPLDFPLRAVLGLTSCLRDVLAFDKTIALKVV